MSAGRVVKIISDVLFVAGLALAGIFLFFQFTGKKPLQVFIVSSGSMEPAIKTGSVVVVAPQPRYEIGDVVTFYTGPAKKITSTHRLVRIDGDKIWTAGDANDSPDPNPVPVSQIIGSARLSLPYLGYLAAFAKTPKGFIFLVIIPATIIIYEELKGLISELIKVIAKARAGVVKLRAQIPGHERRQHASTQEHNPERADQMPNPLNTKWILRPAVVVPVFVALLIPLSLSISFFIDKETSPGNVFGASAPTPTPTPATAPTATPTPTPAGEPTPTPTPGPGDVVINEINWGGSNTDTDDEWLELRNMTANSIDLAGWEINGAISGSGAFTITSGFLPANGFFLISNFAAASSTINVSPNLVDTALQLDNSDAQYILLNPANIIIDTADDGAGTPLAGSNIIPKKSMERLDPPGDGTVSTNWQTATTHTNMDGSGATDEFGTPKAANGL